MSLRVAIMGFGRMGRNIFRCLYERDDIQVVAINDIAPKDSIEYLLRYDSLQGKFPEAIQVDDNYLYAGGRRIHLLSEKEPGQSPWYDYGVDIVIEATGQYRDRASMQRHLDAGADRVILTSPPTDEIDSVYIHGLSQDPLSREHRLISCASSTANCAALMLKLLDDNFKVQSAFFTSVHAYTTEQSLIDSPHNSLRLSRAAVENIVPSDSWTAAHLSDSFPHLQGNIGGTKVNVPVADVSCIDLVCELGMEVEPTEITHVFNSAANSTMKHFLTTTNQPIVSSDVCGSKASCMYDSLATTVCESNLVKCLGWYEQGGGLSYRVLDTLLQLMPGVQQGGRS